MKLILTAIASILFIGMTYSQDCVKQYTGKYKVNLDATIKNIKKLSSTDDNKNEPTEEEMKMMTGMFDKMIMTLEDNALIMSVMGQENKMLFKSRSSADGSACEMVLDLPEGAELPEGTNEVFMTIKIVDKNSIMMKASEGSGSNDMEAIIWSKSK